MDTWLDTRTQVQDTLAHNRQNPAYHSAYLAGAYRKTDLGGTAARNHLAASLPTEPESHDGKANVRYCNASAITHCPGRERCALCGPEHGCSHIHRWRLPPGSNQRASGGFPGQHHGLTAGVPGYAEAGSDAHGGRSSTA